MRLLNALTLSILFIFCQCKPVKNSAAAQDILAVPKGFKTADLFFLPQDKQLLYYQNIHRILPVNYIHPGNYKYPLVESPKDFSKFSFNYNDTTRTLAEYMNATGVVGLIVIRNDTVLLEKYNKGLQPQSKWITFSVAKSVTSLLYGAAIKDGYLQNLDQKVSYYIPELKGSAYDSVSLQHLLQMSSGVAFYENPADPESDLLKMGRIESENGWKAAMQYLSQLKRAAPAGTKFNYNTVETTLAGIILKKIINKPLATYLSEKIWKPFGMHYDANWVVSQTTNMENGGCCISASLRDYALLGLFTMRNGLTQNQEQVLPVNWMQQSTTSAESYKGYGYYWWLRPDGGYFASGSFGQQIEMHPEKNIVIAVESYWPVPLNRYLIGYMDTMFEKLMESL